MIKDVLKKNISLKYRIKLRGLFYRFRWIFYIGNQFHCICCGKSSRKFLPFGNVLRKNAACPYCNSLERTRLLNYYLINETDIFAGNKSILHFAPEGMLAKKLKISSKNYISADIKKDMADVVQDIQSLTFDDNSFDYIICSCVLGHVPDEIAAINEIYRVLKSGGQAFITTVLNLGTYKTIEDYRIQTPEERLKYYGENDLLRFHGEDFFDRLNIANAIVEKIDYSAHFTKQENVKFSLGNKERELIFCFKKPPLIDNA